MPAEAPVTRLSGRSGDIGGSITGGQAMMAEHRRPCQHPFAALQGGRYPCRFLIG
jgi:hypothetical protein